MQGLPTLSYRGPTASRWSLPDPAQVDKLVGLLPFAFVLFDATVGAQQTERSKFSQPENCWLLALVASVSQSAGCMVQIYDTVREQTLEILPVRFDARFGSAQFPFYLRKPYQLPAVGQVQVRVINLAAAANDIQLVGWGLRP
ncbi:MAG TPA: hypothetical protein VNJ12_13400 [Candidatus Dormibacteraeota bacterium]|nr:hypothetical protein [Candidatus Dormibacteraeota bacterium]